MAGQSPSPRRTRSLSRGRSRRRLVAILATAGLTGVTVVSGPAARAAVVPHRSAAPTSTVYTWHLSQDADPSAPPDVPDQIGGGSAQIQSEITDYNTKAQALQSESAKVSAETDSLTQRESDLENQANQVTGKQSSLESQAGSKARSATSTPRSPPTTPNRTSSNCRTSRRRTTRTTRRRQASTSARRPCRARRTRCSPA